jgi:hypothetical protein
MKPYAVRDSVIVGSDRSISVDGGHQGTCARHTVSSAVWGVAKRAWNDTRALQQTLEGLVPGLPLLCPFLLPIVRPWAPGAFIKH